MGNQLQEVEACGAIVGAVAAVGQVPLTEALMAQHLRPLFTRALAAPGVYLASHSLGRPLDCVEADLREGLAVWQHRPATAWEPWLAEEARYRASLAALLGTARVDCVVPRASAGHGLRSVLNMLPAAARVLATNGEFDSVAMVLARYAEAGRIKLERAAAGDDGRYAAGALAERVLAAADAGAAFALVVVSQVFFATGELLGDLDELAEACHRVGARLLVDSYHSLGALPVDVEAMGCDYVLGGCYKYLRGGPGGAFLYLSPVVLAAGDRPLDTGWFALEAGTDAWQPRLRPGGDAHLESTPAVLAYYQARSGLAFTQAVGVKRLRAWGLEQLQLLQGMLGDRGVASEGGDAEHGAFLTVWAGAGAEAVVETLRERGVFVNAQRGRVRLCPDCLTTSAELEQAADAMAACRTLLRG